MEPLELVPRLVAILAADAVNYSRLMSVDERATIVALDSARNVFLRCTAVNGGRVVDTAGDSILAVFNTAVGATAAALAIQSELRSNAEQESPDRRLQFRIGLHLGDVIEKPDGTVYGDGVNIAARLQSLSEPGGTTSSHSIQLAVATKVDATFEDQGEQHVKNIGYPVRTFKVVARPSFPVQDPANNQPADHVYRGGRPSASARSSSLYGRAADLASIRTLLRRSRLVTIVGEGGIGKTAVAQALARQRAQRSGDEAVCFVELAPLKNGALVAPTVAGALGITLGAGDPLSSLAESLRTRRVLVVLDNCEHLVSAVASLVARMLDVAAHVRILITSQEPLRLSGEHVYRLDPLSLPTQSGVESARAAGAVALFCARLQAADRRFSITEHNVAAVVDICCRLDGIPLAIELAAARAPLLGLEGLRTRLDQRFKLLKGGSPLGPERHQTLHAAMEWSYGLLSGPERSVFDRLGVFVGSFALEAAQGVAATGATDAWAVLDHLGSLVEKSLVRFDAGEPPRYRLSATVREFALEKLSAAGELQSAEIARGRAILALFEAAYREQWTMPLQVRLGRYLPELDNLRSVLSWATQPEGDANLLIALAGASKWIWSPSGHRLEGLTWLRRAMAAVSSATSPALDARLHLGYGQLSHPQASAFETGAIDRAIAKYREAGEQLGLYLAYSLSAERAGWQAQWAAARASLEQAEKLIDGHWPVKLRLVLLKARAVAAQSPQSSLKLWQEHAQLCQSIGEATDAMRSRMNAAVACLGSDVDTSIQLLRHLVEVDDREGALAQMSSFARANLSDALLRKGLVDESLKTLQDATAGLLASGLFGTFLDTYSLLLLKKQRPAQAAVALGRADSAFAELGSQRSPDSWGRDNAIDELQKLFSAAELDRLMQKGRALSDAEAARLLSGDRDDADLLQLG